MSSQFELKVCEGKLLNSSSSQWLALGLWHIVLDWADTGGTGNTPCESLLKSVRDSWMGNPKEQVSKRASMV